MAFASALVARTFFTAAAAVTVVRVSTKLVVRGATAAAAPAAFVRAVLRPVTALTARKARALRGTSTLITHHRLRLRAGLVPAAIRRHLVLLFIARRGRAFLRRRDVLFRVLTHFKLFDFLE